MVHPQVANILRRPNYEVLKLMALIKRVSGSGRSAVEAITLKGR
jgi:hypothetical protein